ncbi:bb92cc1f-f4be-4f5d-a1f2-c5d85dcc1fc1 [Thermothielavioides terrestris]|uniref:Bb92cc1f-f4be-4f5d-a1f2-c5d85dcc1fc1 n=1 Tax=Thermothielavioides terrestris TaxID=2587410 RepID=A0A446BLI2_9PEZI|nr:bb92cc1f-f4be-4f5d-a1f2-c5d85dcc1fc1 [Thermothielavioides terrestris]
MALEDHLLLPRDQMCDVKTDLASDPEDGITEETGRILAKDNINGEVWTWGGIWHLIFPEDIEIPDPAFQPVVELAEVEQAFDDCQTALKASLREKLGLLLPGVLDNDYLNFLAGQLDLVFETHRVDIMKQAQSRCCSRQSADLAHQDEEPSSPKRPNRKSRRSTLRQSINRIAAPDAPHPAATSRHARTRSKHKSYPSSEKPIPIRHTTPPMSARIPPTAPDDRHHHSVPNANPSSPAPIYATEQSTTHPCHHRQQQQQQQHDPQIHDTHHHRQHASETPNARDPRDSGIGMPCETCALDGPCQCDAATEQPPAEPREDKHQADKQQRSGGGRPCCTMPGPRPELRPEILAEQTALGRVPSPVSVPVPMSAPPRPPRLSLRTVGDLDARLVGLGVGWGGPEL